MSDLTDSKGSPTPRGIRFRFSIRFLLLATVLIAVILVLSINRARECQKEMAIIKELRVAGLRIERLPPTTFEKILGERFSKQSWKAYVDHDKTELLEQLSKLEKVKSIHAQGGELRNLSAFSKFENLEVLTLNDAWKVEILDGIENCLLYTSPSPRDRG